MGDGDFDVVDYGPRWLEQMLDLWELVQGRRMSREEVAWQFERNPSGVANVHLAVREGRVIGVVSHSALRMEVAGREMIVPFVHNVDTHPDFRRRGVFSTLARASERYVEKAGATLMLAVPNSESKPIFMDRLGWHSLPGPRVSIRISKPVSFAAQWFGTRLPKELRVGSSRPGFRVALRRELALERIDRFEPWVDDLWKIAKPTAAHAVVPSAEHLNWRFREKPGGQYVCFAVRRNDDPVGYMITGRTITRNTLVSYVAHALLHPAYVDEYRYVRKRALAGTSQGCAAALDLTYPGDSPRPHGWFLPTPKRLNLICKQLGSDPPREAIEGEVWRLQLGDLDFF